MGMDKIDVQKYDVLVHALESNGFAHKGGRSWEHEAVFQGKWKLLAIVSEAAPIVNGFLLTDGDKNHVFAYVSIPRISRWGPEFTLATQQEVARILEPILDWIDTDTPPNLIQFTQAGLAAGDKNDGRHGEKSKTEKER